MINARTNLRSLFALLNALDGRPGSLADRVHTITIDNRNPAFRPKHAFWLAAERIACLTPNLRVLDAANSCNAALDHAFFCTIESTAGRTLTSLSIHIGERSMPIISLSPVAKMLNLERLRLDLNFIMSEWADSGHDVPPLILPRVRWFRLDVQNCAEARSWLAAARFQEGCELHLICGGLEKHDSHELNPFWDAHSSRCVRVEEASFGKDSTLFRRCQRVDLAKSTRVVPALFASSSLPQEIQLYCSGFHDNMGYFRSVEAAILGSGHQHAGTRLHIFDNSGQMRDLELVGADVVSTRALAVQMDDMSNALKPCGVVVVVNEGPSDSCFPAPWA